MARARIIQAPSEDPRDKVIALLLAIQEHDPNMTVEDQVFLGCAIRSCRYSLRTDQDKETAPQLNLPQPRPGRVTTRDRFESLLLNSPTQLIDSSFVSERLGLTKKEAGSLIREYFGSVA